MVVRRKIVHLLKIVLRGKIYFQYCPPVFSLGRQPQATVQLTMEQKIEVI